VGLPVVGDPVYGGRLRQPAGASAAVRTALQSFRRQALHAQRLRLRHPISRRALSFEVAPPADFQSLLELLRAEDRS
jgi:23S rRNA pseudouridine1911/1915/1917 synthase